MATIIPISHPDFSQARLAVRLGGLFRSPRLLVDGEEQPRGSSRIRAQNDRGESVEIEIRQSIIDPIPTVKINGEPTEVATPLSTPVKIWIALPLALVFVGGAIGGILAAAAILSNARIFRSHWATSIKFLVSGFVSVLAAMIFWAIAPVAADVIRRLFA